MAAELSNSQPQIKEVLYLIYERKFLQHWWLCYKVNDFYYKRRFYVRQALLLK